MAVKDPVTDAVAATTGKTIKAFPDAAASAKKSEKKPPKAAKKPMRDHAMDRYLLQVAPHCPYKQKVYLDILEAGPKAQIPVVSDAFWSFVREVNWEMNSHLPGNLKNLHQLLWTTHGKERMETFEIEFQNLDQNLYDRLSPYWVKLPGYTDHPINLSDDSFCYLCEHIVGCGQDEYIRCFEDPAHVAARANMYNFTEGFQYIFREEY